MRHVHCPLVALLSLALVTACARSRRASRGRLRPKPRPRRGWRRRPRPHTCATPTSARCTSTRATPSTPSRTAPSRSRADAYALGAGGSRSRATAAGLMLKILTPARLLRGVRPRRDNGRLPAHGGPGESAEQAPDSPTRVTSKDPNVAMQAFAEVLRDMSTGQGATRRSPIPRSAAAVWQRDRRDRGRATTSPAVHDLPGLRVDLEPEQAEPAPRRRVPRAAQRRARARATRRSTRSDPEDLWRWMDAQREAGRHAARDPAQRQRQRRPDVLAARLATASRSPTAYVRDARARTSRSTRSRRSRARRRPTRTSRRTTSSRASSCGTTRSRPTPSGPTQRKGSYARQALLDGLALARAGQGQSRSSSASSATPTPTTPPRRTRRTTTPGKFAFETDPKHRLERRRRPAAGAGRSRCASSARAGLAGVWADGEHARGDLRRDAAQGDLRHLGPAHPRALLRRLRTSRRPTRERADWVARRLRARACRWAATLAPRRRGEAPSFLVAALQGPEQRQPRPHPDREGLGRRRGRAARERSTTSPGAATASPTRDGQAAARSATRWTSTTATYTNTIGARELSAVWTRPRLRPGAARLLLRARARDPDAALEHARRRGARRRDPERPAGDASRSAPGPRRSGTRRG